MKISKFVGLLLTAGLVVMGLFGVLRVVLGLQWGQGIQLASTIFSFALCFSYFAFSKEHKMWWYRILMVWAAMLMISYMGSWLVPGSQSYIIAEEGGVSGFFTPTFIPLCIVLIIFIKEIFKSGTLFELNKNPVLVLLGLIAIIFGVINGVVSFLLSGAVSSITMGMAIMPGEWGPFGLCETAILGIIIGFLFLLKPSKWLIIPIAVTLAPLNIFIAMSHYTDIVAFLALFLATVIFLYKSWRGKSLKNKT